MINECKYGQTRKICPSPLSLSYCNSFKEYYCKMLDHVLGDVQSNPQI